MKDNFVADHDDKIFIIEKMEKDRINNLSDIALRSIVETLDTNGPRV